MRLRVLKELEAIDLDPETKAKAIASYQRSRLADAPDGPTLELHADQIADVLDDTLSLATRRELARCDFTESSVLACLSVARFTALPVKVFGGMYDQEILRRSIEAGWISQRELAGIHHGGNGWGQLAGVARGHGQPYTANHTRREFSSQRPLWIPDHQKIESTEQFQFQNLHRRVDGTDYDSTGRTYKRYHARKWIYFPGEVYRVAIGTQLVGRITTELYARLARVSRRQDRHGVGEILRAWRKTAGEMHRARASLRAEEIFNRTGRRVDDGPGAWGTRERHFAEQIQWSKRERYEARDLGITLPKWRVRLKNFVRICVEIRKELEESLSKKELRTSKKMFSLPSEAKTASVKAARPDRPPRAARSSSRPQDHSAATPPSTAVNPRPPVASGKDPASNVLAIERKRPSEARSSDFCLPARPSKLFELGADPLPPTEADLEALAVELGADLARPADRIAVEELDALSRWRSRNRGGQAP